MKFFSGIIEAASFNKYAINLGIRQDGRLKPDNVIDVAFNNDEVIKLSEKISGKKFKGENPYFRNNTSLRIIEKLLKINNNIEAS